MKRTDNVILIYQAMFPKDKLLSAPFIGLHVTNKNDTIFDKRMIAAYVPIENKWVVTDYLFKSRT